MTLPPFDYASVLRWNLRERQAAHSRLAYARRTGDLLAMGRALEHLQRLRERRAYYRALQRRAAEAAAPLTLIKRA